MDGITLHMVYITSKENSTHNYQVEIASSCRFLPTSRHWKWCCYSIKCQQFHGLTFFFFLKKKLYTISHANDIFSLIRKSFYIEVFIVETL